MYVKYVLGGLLAVLVVMATGFAVTPTLDQRVSPVSFDETLTLGLTGVDVQEAQDEGYSIPQAEVFYSQYQYVIGYYGVGQAADHLSERGTNQQFGRPLAVFVTDYTNADPTLTSDGYLVAQNELDVGWVS